MIKKVFNFIKRLFQEDGMISLGDITPKRTIRNGTIVMLNRKGEFVPYDGSAKPEGILVLRDSPFVFLISETIVTSNEEMNHTLKGGFRNDTRTYQK